MNFKNQHSPTLKELNDMMVRSGGSLDLRGTAITSLPDGLSVGGSLDLHDTAVPIVYEDDRGYELRRIFCGQDEWWVAGCRLFTSRTDALDHWGSDRYPDRTRGRSFCDAIYRTPPRNSVDMGAA